MDALAETFSLEILGSGGNASIWYHATTIDLRAEAEGGGSMHEEDLGVAEPFRGRGLAQIVVGNAADVARSPREVLDLLWTLTVGSSQRSHFGLPGLLQRLRLADPALETDGRLQRLDRQTPRFA